MMTSSYKKLFITLFLSGATFSCQMNNDYDETRKEGYKTFPKREDSWFSNPKDKLDPYGDLSRADYEGVINTDRKFLAATGPVTPKIKMPNLTDLLEDPEEQTLISDKLVSISVNENVPLKDVIVELARRAEVDVEIDQDISGGIIFIAKDKPFSQVIDRICKMAGLRYSFSDGILKIEGDNPYVKNYKFNLLDITRKSQSSINTSFSVGGSESGGSNSSGNSESDSNAGGGTFAGGSNSSLDSQSGDGDIWKNISDGVTKILSMYTSKKAAPAEGQDASAGSSGIISVNKNAGMISLIATDKQHAAVKEYLDRVHIELTSQVLIEARVVEVNLSDEYSSGINWNLVTKGASTTNNLAIGGSLGAAEAAIDQLDGDSFKLSLLPSTLFGEDATIASSIELLQTFGTTRSLSNPRISALNNQFAVLNFSTNEVYFEVEQNSTTTTSAGGSNDQNSVSTNIRSVPIGVVLTLQPSIDLQKSEVLMSVRPTLTRVTSRVEDPGAQIIAAGEDNLNLDSFSSKIPVVDTRELDTMLRIKNGEIMVIGGLLEERSENTDTGLPGISRIPYFGNAFKGVSKTTTNIETVIFIKATIVPGKGVSVEDEDFYKKFTTARTKFMPN